MTSRGSLGVKFELYSPEGDLLNSSGDIVSATAVTKLPLTGRYSITALSTKRLGGSGDGYGPYSIVVQRVAFGPVPLVTTTAVSQEKTGFVTGLTTLPAGRSDSTTGSSPSSASAANPADSVFSLFAIGGIILLIIGGAVFYFMKSKKSGLPPKIPSYAGTGSKNQTPPTKGSHHDVFISYATRDKPIADAICNYLESQQIRCWIAPRDILPGMQYQESIIDGIDSSFILVLVFSADSNESPHVLTEVNEAMSNKVIIIPFRVEDVQPSKSMKYLIGVPHWLDAINPPMSEHIKKLEQTIQVLLQQDKKDQ
jgi:hypothetical protein